MSVLPDSYSYQRGAGPVLHQLTTPLSSRLRRRSNRFGHALNLEAHTQHESDADNANDISFTLPPAFEADDSASDHSDANNASSESVIEEAMSRRQTKAPQGRAAPAAPAPAKKPRGRPKKNTAAVPVEESLRGLGPIPASNANASEPPHIFGSVINDSGGGRSPSIYWQFVYPLKSNIQPDSYTLEGLPNSKDQPDCKEFPYVSCPLCNAPPTTTTPGRSKYVFLIEFYDLMANTCKGFGKNG
jgi:hypothetical protein